MRGSTLILCGLLAGCQAPGTALLDAGQPTSDASSPDAASEADAGTDAGPLCYDWRDDYVGNTHRVATDCDTGAQVDDSDYPTTLVVGGADECVPVLAMGGCEVPLDLASDGAADIPRYECNGRLYRGGTAYLIDERLQVNAHVRIIRANGACEEVRVSFDGERRR
jgi:hypothetical protein